MTRIIAKIVLQQQLRTQLLPLALINPAPALDKQTNKNHDQQYTVLHNLLWKLIGRTAFEKLFLLYVISEI